MLRQAWYFWKISNTYWSFLHTQKFMKILNVIHVICIVMSCQLYVLNLYITKYTLCLHSLSFLNNEILQVLCSLWRQWPIYLSFSITWLLMSWWGKKPGVGVTKAPFINFSVSKIFDLAKVTVRFFESHSYLTGITAAELQRYLSNINMIFDI